MQLGETPWIDETALVEGATLCAWTAVGTRSRDQLIDALEDFLNLTLEQFAGKYGGRNAGQGVV